jgi:hypothetical protein
MNWGQVVRNGADPEEQNTAELILAALEDAGPRPADRVKIVAMNGIVTVSNEQDAGGCFARQ